MDPYPGTPLRLRQRVDLLEVGVLDLLHDELGDAVAPPERQRHGPIMVDQADLDLTAVPGVHGSRRVDHAQARAGGKPGPGVHESGVALRQRHRDAGAHEGSFARLEGQIAGGDQVGSRVAGFGVGRDRDIGVESGQQDLHVRHGRRDYPEDVQKSAEAAGPAGDTPGQGNEKGCPEFRERLYASWWTWPLPVIGAVLMAAQVHMGYPGVRAWLPYVVLVPLAIAIPLWLGRTRVEVRDGELWAGEAHLPLRFVEDVEVVPGRDKRRTLGPDLDPAAYVLHRAWVPTSVRVWLDDPDDPTPYWIVSTRRPEKLAAALGHPTA